MPDRLPPIKGFLPSSLIEWEGKLSGAIFLPGCNFRCPFCHASSLVLRPGELDTIPLAAVISHLDSNKGWLDGIVVSGGEPTLHPGLAPLIATLRDHVPAVKLDSNGTNPHVIEHLIRQGLIDCVAMDIKAPLGQPYHQAAGVAVDCARIQASIELLRSSGIAHEFRTTVVPGLHDREAIVAIARLLGPTQSLLLQQFAPLNCLDPSYMERQPHTRDALRDMARAAGGLLADCRVRGETSDDGPSSRQSPHAAAPAAPTGDRGEAGT